MLILPCATFVPTGVVGAAVSGAIAGPAALSKGDTSVYTVGSHLSEHTGTKGCSAEMFG